MGENFKLWKYESVFSVVQPLSIRNKDREFVAVIVVIVVDDKHLCVVSMIVTFYKSQFSRITLFT